MNAAQCLEFLIDPMNINYTEQDEMLLLLLV